MKAILEFNLPEETIEHQFAINGQKYYCIIEEILQNIRTKLKHGDLSEEQTILLEEIRDAINEQL